MNCKRLVLGCIDADFYLQVNIRWKTLDEIYKICMVLHRSDLNISAKFRETFRIFVQNFVKKNIENS